MVIFEPHLQKFELAAIFPTNSNEDFEGHFEWSKIGLFSYFFILFSFVIDYYDFEKHIFNKIWNFRG